MGKFARLVAFCRPACSARRDRRRQAAAGDRRRRRRREGHRRQGDHADREGHGRQQAGRDRPARRRARREQRLRFVRLSVTVGTAASLIALRCSARSRATARVRLEPGGRRADRAVTGSGDARAARRARCFTRCLSPREGVGAGDHHRLGRGPRRSPKGRRRTGRDDHAPLHRLPPGARAVRLAPAVFRALRLPGAPGSSSSPTSTRRASRRRSRRPATSSTRRRAPRASRRPTRSSSSRRGS
jgi:hypothetical protein